MGLDRYRILLLLIAVAIGVVSWRRRTASRDRRTAAFGVAIVAMLVGWLAWSVVSP